MKNFHFPFFRQLDAMDCGPACLKMVANYYGQNYSLSYLRERSYIGKEGVSLRGIVEASEAIGFRAMGVKVPFDSPNESPSLKRATLPIIVHWNKNHFVVVYRVGKKFVWIADPAQGKIKIPIHVFLTHWQSDGDKGVLLLLEPGSEFHDSLDYRKRDHTSLGFLIPYLIPHRRMLFQILLGLLLSSIFQLFFPFLTQAIVDVGIQNQNIQFLYLILFGQLVLFASQLIVKVIQSWILLHVSIRVNISLIFDFLIKLMQLPLGFFDSKMIGDLMQRIGDHRRIQNFLTQSMLSAILSSMNLLVFGVVLFIYSHSVFWIFFVSAILYVLWISAFLKKRKEIDYLSFQQLSENQNSLIEIIQGMSEIKLQGSQIKRRWSWGNVQAKLFRIQMKSLAIIQYQDAGAMSINEIKNILITFYTAFEVIEGDMTLGMMMAIQYIVGQLNVPLQEVVDFVRAAQDAKISLERLSEVHNHENEETDQYNKTAKIPSGDISLKDICFSYTPISPDVLKDVSITIPRGKITAIVGTSGSGKTTLIKLLLGFYKPRTGQIRIGNTDLSHLQMESWRRQCGVVMQDGYIFSDSISNNIAESDAKPDHIRLLEAIEIANIQDFIGNLPLGFKTIIGDKGNGLSQGQKQRILIARAVYKNPAFLFFDEATNALDTNNEKVIMNKLQRFFEGRTVIVVAHRLSTVREADQIIVLKDGSVVETGNHASLIRNEGTYYKLVKNQLELAGKS